MKVQRTQDSQNKLKQIIGEFLLPDSKTQYKATVIRTVQYWQKDTNIDQQNKIESPEINPCIFGQLSFGKSAKAIQ